MATPIRWDNVQGPNYRDAQSGLDAAARSFQAGLAALGQPLEQAQAIDAANAVTQRNINTNAFLDTIAQYSDADKLKAAQANGTLAALRANYGNNIDAGAVRGAADARVTALQNQDTARLEYESAMRNSKVLPVADRYRAAILNKNPEEAAKAQAEYEALGGRDLAGLIQFADARGRELVTRNQADQTFNLGQDKGRQEIAASKANVDINRGQLAVAQAAQANQARQTNSNIAMNDFNMERTNRQDEAARRAGAAEAAKGALKAIGNIYANGTWDGSQSGDLVESLTKSGKANPTQIAYLVKELNTISKNGVTVLDDNGRDLKDKNGNPIKIKDIPLTAVEQAAASATNSWPAGYNEGYAKSFSNNLQNILRTLDYKTENGKKVAYSKAADDLAAYHSTIANALSNAPGILPNRPRQAR